jgi:hypothetical protein
MLYYFITTRVRNGEKEYICHNVVETDRIDTKADMAKLAQEYVSIYEDYDQIEKVINVEPMTEDEAITVSQFIGWKMTEGDMRGQIAEFQAEQEEAEA